MPSKVQVRTAVEIMVTKAELGASLSDRVVDQAEVIVVPLEIHVDRAVETMLERGEIETDLEFVDVVVVLTGAELVEILDELVVAVLPVASVVLYVVL